MLSDAEATIYAATRNMLDADATRRSETRQGTLAGVARDAIVNYLIALDVYDNDVEAHRAVHGGLILHRAEPEPEPSYDTLYADWRADRITDAEFRSHLARLGVEHPSDRAVREAVES